jgi:hypothetical protein
VINPHNIQNVEAAASNRKKAIQNLKRAKAEAKVTKEAIQQGNNVEED